MTPEIREQIQARSYEIWEYRMEFGSLYVLDERGNLRDITEQDDWLEAEEEIVNDKRKRLKWLKPARR